MKLVSIIVRTKDRPLLLREALQSLAIQEYPHFEVIVVNDGGEEVGWLVAEFSERFSRLKYLSHEGPRGRAAAANTGLSAIEGDFFAFLDDDDLLLPEHFSFLLSHASSERVVYSRARFEIYGEEGQLERSFSPWEGEFRRENLLFGNFIPLHTLLFPVRVLEKIGDFDEDLELFEDWDFLLRVSAHFPFKALDRITAIYRFFPQGGISRTAHASSREKEAFFKVIARHQEILSPETIYNAHLRRAALRYELSLKEEENLGLKGALAQKEEALKRLEELKSQKEQEISSLKQEINILKQEKEALYEKGLSLEREKEALKQEKEALLKQLRLMEETLGWQLLEKARDLLRRVAPPGSRREEGLKLLKLLLRLGLSPSGRRTLLLEGRKFAHYVRHFGLRAALARALAKTEALPLPPAEKDDPRGKILKALLKPPVPPHPLTDPVTICIPVYNAYEKVKTCLHSVLKNTDLSRAHLLVIDDASTDPRILPYLQNLSRRFGFELRTHKYNRGFVATVNEAMASRRGHLVILNSDTEVPPGWLERLLAPILAAPDKVASVTPFSNRATICSFPEFCQDNDLPPGLTVEEIDRLFCSFFGKVPPIEIPTGVGFCLALNDQALKKVGFFDEETFGRGYGEENDWCLRAEAWGFKNLLVPWLFVAHHHGASFGEEKKRLAEEGVQRVERKHPGYLARIQAFISQDPIREIRETARTLLEAYTSPPPRGLVLTHSLGGGAEIFLKDFKKLFPENSLMFLRFDGKNFLLEDGNKFLHFFLEPEEFPQLLELLSRDFFFLNHLGGVRPLFSWLKALKAGGRPSFYFLHDYYPLCPSYTLVNEKGVFCGLPEDEGVCCRCLRRKDLSARGMIAGTEEGVEDLAFWRKTWARFLEGVLVVSPSATATELFKRVFPQVEIRVVPHFVPPLTGYKPPERDPERPLVIAVLGALSLFKGAEVVYRLAEAIRENSLPLRLVLFGYTYRERKRNSPELVITGPYRREELPTLCKQFQPEVALIPSLWPETFSYTASEALSLGLPLVVFDLGAQAEKVRQTGAGLLIPPFDEKALLESLLSLHEDPPLLETLKERARRYRPLSFEAWKGLWHEIFSLSGIS